MRLLITKTFAGVVDTAKERARIREAFRGDPVTRKKLTELMDAVEALDWKRAERLLLSKWWQGRDRRQGCPRVEFIGLLDAQATENGPRVPAWGFDVMSSYINLVAWMNSGPAPDRVITVRALPK